ncbi:MAG: thiamine phosphate synthase [Caulobacter sp.]|nr:thiamine phosphate synthase [Caulobacter sp.]
MSGSDLGRLQDVAAGLRPRWTAAKPLPRLFCLTDPDRTPDPEALAAGLPAGTGLIFRAFGAADAPERGRRLAGIAAERGLLLLAGADPDLALAMGAAGLHLPERDRDRMPELRRAHPAWVLTCAAHSLAAAAEAARLGADAVLVSPVFASRSPSAGAPLGVDAFTAIVGATAAPVYALGGVTAETANRLIDSGAAGLAGIEGFNRL